MRPAGRLSHASRGTHFPSILRRELSAPGTARRLLLFGNCILTDRQQAQEPQFNSRLTGFLRDFPALGQFLRPSDPLDNELSHDDCSIASFPMEAVTLLAFQYTTRGRVQEIPKELVPTLLGERVPRAVAVNSRMLPDDEPRSQRICHASVLFSILRQNPSVVTREACNLHETPVQVLSMDDNDDQKLECKRRKLA